VELGEVLPRRPDGAGDGALAGSHGELGKEGNRDPLVGHHGLRRRGLHVAQGARRPGGGAGVLRIPDRDAPPGAADRSDHDAGDGLQPRRPDGLRVGGPGQHLSSRLRLVLPVRLQGTLEPSRQLRPVDEATTRR
jgi:hypothetical protein